MYLQHILKDGPAKFVIQQLTQTSASYKEAIKYLKERDNWPWLIHKEHVCNIVDAVPVKNSSHKEFCCLCHAAIQHYRVLKVANNDSFDTVLTVILLQK